MAILGRLPTWYLRGVFARIAKKETRFASQKTGETKGEGAKVAKAPDGSEGEKTGCKAARFYA